MRKRSKRYNQAKTKVDENKKYSFSEAVEILKTMPKAKFDETLELSCHLDVDVKQSDQMVRGSVVLPQGSGKKVTVIVFCEAEKEGQAKEAGADYVGSQELIDKVFAGWMEFDYCIATPSMMKFVSKLGKILGPRGLMPSPKTGSVTDNIGYAVKDAKKGKVDFRVDKLGCIHLGLGKMSLSKEALLENIGAFMEALNAARPATVSLEFIKSLFLSTTMSPSLRIGV